MDFHSKSHFPTSSTNRDLPFRETRPGLAQIAVSGVSWTWTLDLGLDLGSMRIQGNQWIPMNIIGYQWIPMNIIECQWESMSRDPGSHCSPPELDLLKSPGGGRNEKSALGPDLEYFIHRRTLVLLVSNFLTTTRSPRPYVGSSKMSK